MKYGRVAGALWLSCVLGVLGCGDPPAVVRDAPELDAEIDAQRIDAAIDAAVDAPPDASSLSPACGTAPAILIDVTPRQLGNIAISGNVMYVSAADVDGGSNVTNGRVFSIDLTTESEYAAPLTTVGFGVLSMAGTDVYATDRVAGTIWRLRPGEAPLAVVEDRIDLRVATADATHVYWSEGDAVVRRALAGGTVEPVLTCDSAMDLLIDGDTLYCAGFSSSLKYGPKVGGGTGSTVVYNGYPISSMVRDGNDLFFTNLYNNPQIHRVPLPIGPASLVVQIPELTRVHGIAMSSDYFYLTGTNAVRRIHRTTLAIEKIFIGSTSTDPLLWNNDLYFLAPNPQLSGDRYVMHCVN